MRTKFNIPHTFTIVFSILFIFLKNSIFNLLFSTFFLYCIRRTIYLRFTVMKNLTPRRSEKN